MDLSDRDQFDAQYRRLAPLCLRIARKVLGDNAAAEEVVQDLFLKLWRNPGAFDPERGSLESYVAMAARSRSIDRWRTRSAERQARERLESESRILRRAHQLHGRVSGRAVASVLGSSGLAGERFELLMVAVYAVGVARLWAGVENAMACDAAVCDAAACDAAAR